MRDGLWAPPTSDSTNLGLGTYFASRRDPSADLTFRCRCARTCGEEIGVLFLTMMVIGLVGLVMMALPALGGHHLPPSHGHGLGHIGAHGAGPGAVATHAHPAELPAPSLIPHPSASLLSIPTATSAIRRVIPSPRAAFSLFALYGASGNALVHAGHLSRHSAALLAIGPALLVEWFLVRPIWNLMFRFKADASSPLETLILAEAQAVVPFRNGRGVVTTVRDGRSIQLNARLCDQHAAMPVAFGQRLRIEDVDARNERVTVSVLPNDRAIDNNQT